MAKLLGWDDSKLATVRSLSLAAQGAKAFTAAPCGGSGSLTFQPGSIPLLRFSTCATPDQACAARHDATRIPGSHGLRAACVAFVAKRRCECSRGFQPPDRIESESPSRSDRMTCRRWRCRRHPELICHRVAAATPNSLPAHRGLNLKTAAEEWNRVERLKG